jgi:hypothetical protein
MAMRDATRCRVETTSQQALAELLGCIAAPGDAFPGMKGNSNGIYETTMKLKHRSLYAVTETVFVSLTNREVPLQ